MAGEEILTGFIANKMPSGELVLKFAAVLGIVVVIVGLLAFLIYMQFQKRIYNKKIKLFRKVGGRVTKIAEDMAMFERIGIGGDMWCKTKTFKKIIPKPRIQMEPNCYWMYEREDGEWINFSLEDIDLKMKEANAYFVDEDMRLQRLGIQKNLAARFQKQTFMEKYGGMIIYGLFVLVVTVCLVVLFQKMEGAYTGAAQMADSVKTMAEALNNLVSHTQSGIQVLK